MDTIVGPKTSINKKFDVSKIMSKIYKCLYSGGLLGRIFLWEWTHKKMTYHPTSNRDVVSGFDNSDPMMPNDFENKVLNINPFGLIMTILFPEVYNIDKYNKYIGMDIALTNEPLSLYPRVVENDINVLTPFYIIITNAEILSETKSFGVIDKIAPFLSDVLIDIFQCDLVEYS